MSSGASFRLGFECTMFVNTGTYATPIWRELDTVTNTSLVVQNAVADVSMRRGKGWASEMNALTRLPIQVEAIYEKNNVDLEQFFDAAVTKRDFLDVLFLDGPLVAPVGGVASEGLRFWANVSDWERGEELENAVAVSFTLGTAPFPANQEPKIFLGTVAT